MKVLLDTNIGLDFYFGSRKNHKEAVNLINYLVDYDIEIYTPSCGLNNFYYISDKIIKSMQKNKENDTNKIEAGALFKAIHDLSTIVGMDESDVFIAEKLKSIHNDFEDNQILAAAMRIKSDFLITNDKDLIKHANVACMSPSNFLKIYNNTD